MYFIGITGGVGAGKSTVLNLLKENFNCKILLADEVAAELLTPGHDCFDKVVGHLALVMVGVFGDYTF